MIKRSGSKGYKILNIGLVGVLLISIGLLLLPWISPKSAQTVSQKALNALSSQELAKDKMAAPTLKTQQREFPAPPPPMELQKKPFSERLGNVLPTITSILSAFGLLVNVTGYRIRDLLDKFKRKPRKR